MVLPLLLAIAIVLLVLGLILRRRSKLGNTIHSMRTVSWILISIGVLGIIVFVVIILSVSGVFGPPASQLRVTEGKELHKQGRLEEAIDKYTEAIRIEPTWKGLYYLRGIAYCDLGQYELGIEDFNEGIRFGYRGEKYYRRGLAYAELGRKAEAIADFEKFISLTDDPERAEEAREEIEELQSPAPTPTESETVTFPDDNLEAAIRDALGKPVGEEIAVAELAGLTTLQAEDSGIADLSGLEYCTNLTRLSLEKNEIREISPLSNLTNLTKLWLWNNQISDIYPLASLTNLTELGLWGNQISDITPLSNLTSLTWLSLEHNEISDISPLSNLTNLTELWLWNNQISDISPLENLTSLTWLKLVGNQISDISALVENSGLGKGDEVVLEDNNLDLSKGSEDMENIRALEDRGVIAHY